MGDSCECGEAAGCTCGGRCTDSMCVLITDGSFRSESGVPLVTAGIGEGGRIVRVSGRQDIRKFLCGLGLVIGAHVSVVNENSGNLILDVKGSRIAMD
ncbi:MAG: ferrous iron transport protein A, partial [Methanomassiliicoccaceae archaeon]|nr:ferrous iron transport protein A [Methanomassiliicoccaceae archaeon]